MAQRRSLPLLRNNENVIYVAADDPAELALWDQVSHYRARVAQGHRLVFRSYRVIGLPDVLGAKEIKLSLQIPHPDRQFIRIGTIFGEMNQVQSMCLALIKYINYYFTKILALGDTHDDAIISLNSRVDNNLQFYQNAYALVPHPEYTSFRLFATVAALQYYFNKGAPEPSIIWELVDHSDEDSDGNNKISKNENNNNNNINAVEKNSSQLDITTQLADLKLESTQGTKQQSEDMDVVMDTSNNNNNTMSGGLGLVSITKNSNNDNNNMTSKLGVTSVNKDSESKEMDIADDPMTLEQYEKEEKMRKINEYFPWYCEADAEMLTDTDAASLIVYNGRGIRAAIDCISRKHWEHKDAMHALITRLFALAFAIEFNNEMDNNNNNNNNNNSNNTNENEDSKDNNDTNRNNANNNNNNNSPQ